MNSKPERRTFLIQASAAVTSALALPLSALAQQKPAQQQTAQKPRPKRKAQEPEEEVSTNEDLMREHGVLNRILLIYDAALRRIQANDKFDPAIISKSAGLIQKFIENYHEKLEEDHLFPRFEKAGKLVDLVKVLRAQHAAGRTVTNRIISASNSGDLTNISGDLAAFIHMYRPHEAREDTVLFPALHDIVSKREYDAMGEQFETIERQTFGGDGFDMAVDQVTELEKQMGIFDLAQFTPK